MDILGCNYMVFLSNIVYISSVLIPSMHYKYITLLVLMILQILELSAFIYIRAKQITDYLNIRIFCVNTTPQIVSTAI